MKSKLILFFICLCTLSSWGQQVVTRPVKTIQKTEVKPVQQKKPVQTAKPTPVKKCTICGLPLSQCNYGGNHPKEMTCPDCGKLVSRCEYKGNHPICKDCKKVIGGMNNACLHKGTHPEPNSFEVSFSCNVSSAILYVDGNNMGTLSGPKTITTGSHEIKLVANGYETYIRNITVGKSSTKFSFTMMRKKNEHNGHEYVDLGLSVKWATCNVGATKPEDYGYYFAWGETKPKQEYNIDNCFDCIKPKHWLKESAWAIYRMKGNKYRNYIPSTSGHDAARENWGGDWRMPTYYECKELCDKCTWMPTTLNGHIGCVVKGPNGNSIFLPAAGGYDESDFLGEGEFGHYWINSLSAIKSFYANDMSFQIQGNYQGLYCEGRHWGLTIRPVR